MSELFPVFAEHSRYVQRVRRRYAAELPRLQERGHQALAVMERHLQSREFFVDSGYSIADIALYAYTHAAADGGFDLEPYPAIRAWLERVARQPRHVAQTA